MKGHNGEKSIEFIRKNKGKYTALELAQKFNVTDAAIYGRLRSRGMSGYLKPVPPGRKGLVFAEEEKDYALHGKLREQGERVKDMKRREGDLLDALREKEAEVENALAIAAYKPKPIRIEPLKQGSRGEGTAVALLSDVHCEEIIEDHKVNYLNKHNPEISRARVTRFFQLVLKFIRVDRAETDINNLVLWLGGDFFTNEAHDAPIAFPPITAAMFAQDMIVAGLRFLRTEEPNLSIHIIGSVGNHSRMQIQRPVNVASEQEHSLEWMMYHAVRGMFEHDKKIKFQLDNSYHTYAQIYSKTIRFNHGHLGWRYNDGLGGIHGPVWKAISQKWDKQYKADLTCFGHYHTYTPAAQARPYISNGSTVGASAYGMQFGFEEPSQAYFLIHDRHGIVNQRPLFVNS